MKLTRRELGTAAGVSVSVALAGCSALQDDEDEAENESDWEFEDGDDSNSAAENESDAPDGSDDEPTMHEDESVEGTILLSDDAEEHLEVVRHTFTWLDEQPSDQCHVHVMLANTSGAEFTADMEARIYDEDGTERSSTTREDEAGPEPGVDDAVYSLELGDCEGTATYEFEITAVDADEPDGPDGEDGTESDEREEPDEPEDTDADDEELDDEELDDEELDDGDETDESDETDDDEATEPGDSDDQEDSDDQTDDDPDDSDDPEDGEDDEEDGDGDADAETYTLRVIVQDGDGDPIDHATVDVDEGGFAGWRETRTVDSRGRVEFEVPEGEYEITVSAEGYPTLQETLEVDVNLEYTVTLRASS